MSVNGEENDLAGPSTNAIRGDFLKDSSLRLVKAFIINSEPGSIPGKRDIRVEPPR